MIIENRLFRTFREVAQDTLTIGPFLVKNPAGWPKSVPVSRVSGEGFSPFTKIAEEPTLYYQKQRLSRALEPRLRAVIEHNISELNGFARSLGQDKGAVLAPLTLSWSNGQVEGQVNRLKLIKRQMYGRAQLDLLPLRALAPSGP